jgi:hypothetical protein
MASRRWVITTPPPKTATCPRCRRTRNRLSVYPTFEGKACYSCLTSAPAVDRTAVKVAAPPLAEPIASPATAAARPTACPEVGCGRLPAHKGDHRATLRRRPDVAARSSAPSVGA